MRDNPERGDLDPADDVSKRCQEEFIRFILHRQEKAVIVVAKSEQFTVGETGKGQFL